MTRLMLMVGPEALAAGICCSGSRDGCYDCC